MEDTATWTHKKDAVKAEKKSCEKLKKQATQHEDQVAKEEERLSKLEESHKASNDELKSAEAAAEAAEITLQGVQSGTGAGGDGNKSLQTQLGDATAAASQAGFTIPLHMHTPHTAARCFTTHHTPGCVC